MSSINPDHYKDVIPNYQYIDLMVHLLSDLQGVEAHLIGQAYKYMMRYGKKDCKIQELEKAIWYLEYLVKHLKEIEDEELGRQTAQERLQWK